MTGIIYTIHVCVSRFAALMTMSNDLIGDPFTQPLIKDKILSVKLIGQSPLLYLVSIVNNAALQMKNILKSFVKHEGRSFFATDATGAVHDDIFVSFVTHHINRHG